MEVVICSDVAQAASRAADTVEALFSRSPDAVLGIATGSSPVGIYEELGRRVSAGRLSLAKARAFMLDEYVGLPSEHPERYQNVILRDFVAKVDIDADNVHGPDGLAEDLDAACAAYERAIVEAGGVDLQILGVGTDGHIAFNEPGSSLASRTRIKCLTRQTRQDNARFFGGDVDQVPLHCLTQGIATIMAARHLVLIASGEAKAEAIRQVVEGSVSAMWPGTILQMHPHVTVFVDKAAASQLTLADYFNDVYNHKHLIQGR
ncbi:glucosamine-6-phosphate deaminase [Gephyromycinifex aptenodytis]|uniref:glucosamine-6-phosphate deaminase n=1 Tax=Gephyromycinifex aptenodytis TaxID=2716227 RepID=UPI0014468B5F|nr:glucosamine-6-phosphate deaminase [Gephyromycinifex aptenodytis]